MSRKNPQSKAVWLETGIQILTNRGPANLTIENLTKLTGRTKGSFYHHFKSRKHYIGDLLNSWTNSNTLSIIEASEAGKTAITKLKRLLNLVLKIPEKTELAIRSWALYEPIVKKYQDKIDQERIRYLNQLYYSIIKDKNEALNKAYITYSKFIGYQQLKHCYDKNRNKKLVSEMFEDLQLENLGD